MLENNCFFLHPATPKEKQSPALTPGYHRVMDCFPFIPQSSTFLTPLPVTPCQNPTVPNQLGKFVMEIPLPPIGPISWMATLSLKWRPSFVYSMEYNTLLIVDYEGPRQVFILPDSLNKLVRKHLHLRSRIQEVWAMPNHKSQIFLQYVRII